jgi:MarR family transcriptional regulator for hemolysin
LTQKQLAARLSIEGPTLVRTLDWLEREGLVERREAAHDRRAKTLHLTRKARPLIERIEAAATEVRAEILAGIPEAELAACLQVLERVAERVGACLPSTPPTAEEEDPSDGHRAA